MDSPHKAIAWQLYRPYRWWIWAGLGWLAAVALAGQLLPPGRAFDVAVWYLASPLVVAALGMLSAFSYGSGMDLALRESGFPGRMLTLPLSSRALAGWPMLYGALALAALWLAVAGLILRPRGVDAPLFWPALFAAGFLWWFQVICWSSFALPWLRLFVSLGVLGGYTGLVALGLRFGLSSLALSSIIAAQLPLALAAAVSAVWRARRGDVPEWRWLARRSRRPVPRPVAGRRPFHSALDAQTWFEWRLNGGALLGSTCLLLPALAGVVVLSTIGAGQPGRSLLGPLVMLLGVPLFSAASAGPVMGRFGQGKQAHLIPSFLATRPARGTTLIAAKFRAAARSVLVAQILTLATAGLLVAFTAASDEVAARYRSLCELYSPAGAAAVVLLAVALSAAATWAVTAQGMWMVLTGRQWVTVGYGTLIFVVLYGLLFVGWWLQMHPQYQEPAKAVGLWLPAAFAAAKLLLAGWLLRVLLRRRLVDAALARRAAGAWLAAAAVLGAGVWWLAPAELVPWHCWAGGVVLAMPTLGIELAPLAVAWNRHR